MKAVIIALLVAAAVCTPATFISQENVDHINSVQNSWVAEVPERFVGMSFEEIQAMFGTRVPEDILDLPEANYEAVREFQDLPTDFDVRTKWPKCTGPIRDQKNCGSCWAFGAVESFEDRLCIAQGADSVKLYSPQHLVDCDTGSFGCRGGWPVKAWEYQRDKGVSTEKCYPYKALTQTCKSVCADGSAFDSHKATNVHKYASINDVKTDIFNSGGVETWFAVYQDFLSYKKGVYTPTSRVLLGYHATEVNGWGVDATAGAYWISRNSWGAGWGNQGYFNIAAGTCQFDQLDHFVAGEVKK